MSAERPPRDFPAFMFIYYFAAGSYYGQTVKWYNHSEDRAYAPARDDARSITPVFFSSRFPYVTRVRAHRLGGLFGAERITF